MSKPLPTVVLTREACDRAYEALKPVALRATGLGERTLATVLMRFIEDIRGDEKKTETPKSHHE